jgi:hypothetical protein
MEVEEILLAIVCELDYLILHARITDEHGKSTCPFDFKKVLHRAAA